MAFKGAVCRILTLLKHKNTIICLQIFKKHAKLTYLFIWKTMLQSVILLWKCVNPTYSTFKQSLYFKSLPLNLFDKPTGNIPILPMMDTTEMCFQNKMSCVVTRRVTENAASFQTCLPRALQSWHIWRLLMHRQCDGADCISGYVWNLMFT